MSKKIINKTFKPNLINKMNDEEAIEYLSSLRQIGRWSAEMILLFTFNDQYMAYTRYWSFKSNIK